MLDVPTAHSLLQNTRPSRHADGYPPEVRASVVILARARLATGLTIAAAARELGLNRGTLQQWLARTAEQDSFVPVVIQGAIQRTDEREVSPRPCPSLTLVAPSGFRLDGLCLDDAIHALRELS